MDKVGRYKKFDFLDGAKSSELIQSPSMYIRLLA